MRTTVLVAITLVVVAATVGQWVVTMGGKSPFWFPPATGMFQQPFRQAQEKTIGGQARTEIACVTSGSSLAWMPFDERVIDAMSGPHHRKVAIYRVLSDSMPVRNANRARRATFAATCERGELRSLLGCSGKGEVGLRNRLINGLISRDLRWTCPT